MKNHLLLPSTLIALCGLLSSCDPTDPETPDTPCAIEAVDDVYHYTIPADGSLSPQNLGVLLNDAICWGADSIPVVDITLSISSAPTSGTASVDSDLLGLDILYTPSSSAVAGTEDHLSYTICKADGTCSSASVTIIFTEAPPCGIDAVEDEYHLPAGSDLCFMLDAASNDILCTTDPSGSDIVFTVTSTPSYGVASFTGWELSYCTTTSPSPGATDVFTYQVCVGGECDETSVTIHFSADSTTDCAGFYTLDDEASLGGMLGTVTIDVLANDRDCPTEGLVINPASLNIVTAPLYGTASIVDGVLVYTATSTPPLGAVEVIMYEVCTFSGECAMSMVYIH